MLVVFASESGTFAPGLGERTSVHIRPSCPIHLKAVPDRCQTVRECVERRGRRETQDYGVIRRADSFSSVSSRLVSSDRVAEVAKKKKGF